MRNILYIIALLFCLPGLVLGQSSGTGPFSLTAPTAATANVQWYKNGTAISGVISATYSATTKGVYWASYDVTTPSSCSGLVTAYDVVLQEGDTDIKSLVGPASQTAYQWYKDGAIITGATTATLSLANSTSAVGTYYLSYNNGSCVLTTGNFYVYVLTCNAGITPPGLSTLAISNICPATTVNLSSITASNTPAGATLTWHSGTPATTANKLSAITALAAGTYYAAFFDATNNCYSGTNGAATTQVTATTVACCIAGNTAPTLSSTTPSNVCPTTTVDLSSLVTGSTPSGTSLVWFTNNAHTGTAYSTPTTAGAGTYYAFYYDATNACYSPASSGVTVTINASLTTPSLSGAIQPTCSVATGTFTISNYSASNTYTVSPSSGVSQSGATITASAGTYTVQASAGSCISTASSGITLNAVTGCCSATVAPALSATTKANVCPATTVDLTTLTASNLPATATLSWFTGPTASSSNLVSSPAGVSVGTYYAAFYDATNNCYGPTTAVTATVTVCTIPCAIPSVGGTAAYTGATLCGPTNTGNITLSGNTGSVVKWQTSTNGGTTWTDLAGTATTYTFTNAVNNQQYRAVVNSGGTCVDAFSSPATLAVTTTPAIPTLSVGTQPTCSVATGTFTISNYSASNSYTVSPSSGVSQSGATITAPAGTYTVQASTGSCISTASSGITLNAVTGCCSATGIPALSATSQSNVCPATTVNLNTITASNTPVSTTLTWHTSTTATTANRVSNPASAAAGTYYAAFYDATGDCYSTATTQVTVTITVCAPPLPPTIAITSPANITTTSTNPPISGTATALASVTVNGPNGQQCLTTANASGNWTCSSLTFTVGSQTVTAIASNTAGVSTTATTTFTVIAPCATPSVGGTVAFAGTFPLCNVSNAGSLSLTGQTGSVVKWQTSTDGGSSWTDVVNTATSLTFTNAANNQQYRVVVNSGGTCADAPSSPVTITTSASACSADCAVLPSTITK